MTGFDSDALNFRVASESCAIGTVRRAVVGTFRFNHGTAVLMGMGGRGAPRFART